MKTSKIMKSLAALLILSVVETTAFGGPQRVEQAAPQKGERYAYVWVTGSRVPQKVKISRSTAEDVLRQDPSISVRLGH